MARSIIQENVIALSTQIDNAGIQNMFRLLDSSRMKYLAVAGALTAATTATYKFLQSMTKKEFEYEKLAVQQKKSIENTRAEQEALKAMGATLNDINKDKALKGIYEDIVKFNKELQMPNMRAALQNVNKLRGEFWKLKSAVANALQYIGAQVLTNLEMPMERIGGKLKAAAEWIRDNLPSISARVGSFITAFSKGIIGIGEGVMKVFKYINDLPDGIKAIAVALGGLFLLIKTGPVGQILALVTVIGDIIHDYEDYQWNKKEGLNPGDEGYVGNLNDIFGIWDIFDKEGIAGLGNSLLDAIIKSIKSIPAEELGKQFGELLNDIFGKITSALTGGGSGFFGKFFEAANALGVAFFGFISSAIENINLSQVKGMISAIVQKLFSLISEGVVALSAIMSSGKGNGGVILSIVDGIIDGITKGFDKLSAGDVLDSIQNIASKIFQLIVDGLSLVNGIFFGVSQSGGMLDSINKFVIGFIQRICVAFNGINTSQVATSIKGIINSIFTMIGNVLSTGVSLIFGGTNENGEFEAGLLQYGTELAVNIINIIAEGAADLTDNSGIITMLQNLFEKVFTVDNINAAFDAVGTIATTLIEAIGTVFTDLTGGENGAIGALTELFKKIFTVDNINAAFKNVTNLASTLVESIGTVFTGLTDKDTGVVEALKNLFSSIFTTENIDAAFNIIGEAVEPFESIISNIFSIISSLISEGLDLLLGDKAEDGSWEAGLLDYAVDIVSSFVKSLGEGAGNLPLEKIGSDIGKLINGIYTKIGNWLTENAPELAKLPGDLLTSLGKIASTILDGIIAGFDELFAEDDEGKTGIQRFADGIFKTISDAIDDLFKRITSDVGAEGHIDLVGMFSDIGGKIGNALGSAISAALDFMSKLIENARKWLADGGTEKLIALGGEIASAILSGIGSILGDTIMRIALGKEGYDRYKKNEKSSVSTSVDKENKSVTVRDKNGVSFTRSFKTDEEAEQYAQSVENMGAKTATDVFEVEGMKGGNDLANPKNYYVLPNEYNADILNSQMKYGSQMTDTTDVSYGLQALLNLFGYIDNLTKNNPELLTDEIDSVLNAFSNYFKGDTSVDIASVYKTLIDFAKNLDGVDFLFTNDPLSRIPNAGNYQTYLDEKSGSHYVLKTNESGEIDWNAKGYLSNQSGELEEVTAQAMSKLQTNSKNLSLVDTNARNAASSMGLLGSAVDTFVKNVIRLNDAIDSVGGSDGEKAWGGRIGSRGRYTVGEDGTEYIIPITKPERAFSLINQMLSEMGSSAIERVMSGFGIGNTGTIGSSQLALDTALQGMSMVNNYNISAPVSINVNSSGASAEQIGTSIYNSAERHLIKTLRGACA